jgi:hypothetical protein
MHKELRVVFDVSFVGCGDSTEYRETAVLWLRIWVSGLFVGLSGHNVSFLVPWYSSKSGLTHKHIVKHMVKQIGRAVLYLPNDATAVELEDDSSRRRCCAGHEI